MTPYLMLFCVRLPHDKNDDVVKHRYGDANYSTRIAAIKWMLEKHRQELDIRGDITVTFYRGWANADDFLINIVSAKPAETIQSELEKIEPLKFTFIELRYSLPSQPESPTPVLHKDKVYCYRVDAIQMTYDRVSCYIKASDPMAAEELAELEEADFVIPINHMFTDISDTLDVTQITEKEYEAARKKGVEQ